MTGTEIFLMCLSIFVAIGILLLLMCFLVIAMQIEDYLYRHDVEKYGLLGAIKRVLLGAK